MRWRRKYEEALAEKYIALANASACTADLSIVREKFKRTPEPYGGYQFSSDANDIMRYPDLWGRVSAAFKAAEERLAK